ncbi:MAG: hypothetical protein M3348_03365 [Acidobacteriota bacterium]|nr:hypothetical protein [Acidobacteriota bacterium]
MSFTKLLLSAACLACLATAARAQAACTLTVDKAPSIRGLRLGMTLGEVKSFAPDIRVTDLGFGESTATLNLLDKADPARFKGVNAVFLHFVDERVTDLSVLYDPSVNWESTSQFVAKVSEALKLPPAWEGGDSQTMACDGFKITAQPNNISLGIPDADKVVRRRKAEAAEKKRQDFRP